MSCRQRITTYRKLASRIERATARLQAEWGIERGSVVAYCGNGHQDAIVLYLALLQCGASLLVTPAGERETGGLLREYGVRVALNESGEEVVGAPAGLRIEPLHAIIASRCPHPAHPIVDGWEQCSVLTPFPASEDGAATAATRRQAGAMDLFAGAHARSLSTHVSASEMFGNETFAPVILATLAGGAVLRFK
jgi:hypothetical protein